MGTDMTLNLKHIIIVNLVLGLIILGGVSYVVWKKGPVPTPEEQSQINLELQEESANQRFSSLLDEMVKKLANRATDYRQQRLVLQETLHPVNFETPDNAKESYRVFVHEVVPLLNRSADSVMAVFAEYDKKMEKLLGTAPDDLRTEIAAQWEEMRTTQLSDYVAFFEKEDRIIAAYQDLLKFYAQHSASYTVNVETESFVFNNTSVAVEEKRLLAALEEIKKSGS